MPRSSEIDSLRRDLRRLQEAMNLVECRVEELVAYIINCADWDRCDHREEVSSLNGILDVLSIARSNQNTPKALA